MPNAAEPLVSVLMSVYNGERWLQKAISSVTGQSYSNWEFIIVDDASTDGTKGILQQYEKDPRFKLIYSGQNAGCVKSFNTGIDHCNGLYTARFDADDICTADRFKKQSDFLTAHPDVAMVASFVDFINDEDVFTGIWEDDRRNNSNATIRKSLPFLNCIAHPSVMIRTAILKQYRYNEMQLNCEDWDLWMRLAADNQRIEKMQEPLLQYRVHGSSITAHSFKRSAFWKNNYGYRQYLKLVFRYKKINWFNIKVLAGFCINYIKLILSNIKRSFRPS